MAHSTRAGILKRMILLFWPAWISIVVVMNVLNVLKVAGILPHDWALASENYKAIADMTAKYGVPQWLDMVLFLGAIGWEIAAAILLWRALRAYHARHANRWRRIYLGFSSLLALFFSFIVVDEIFGDFHVERDHRGIALLLLASLLVLTLIPEKVDA
jgi:hypothetical protein